MFYYHNQRGPSLDFAGTPDEKELYTQEYINIHYYRPHTSQSIYTKRHVVETEQYIAKVIRPSYR